MSAPFLRPVINGRGCGAGHQAQKNGGAREEEGTAVLYNTRPKGGEGRVYQGPAMTPV